MSCLFLSGDVFRGSLSISPMAMDVGADLLPGWDWISSRDLRLTKAAGEKSCPAGLQMGPHLEGRGGNRVSVWVG